MRPLVPDPFQDRSYKSSTTDQPVGSSLTDPRNAAPSTFFLAREDDIDADDSNRGRNMEDSQTSTFGGPEDSSYGVQSLESTIDGATVDTTRDEDVRVPTDKEQQQPHDEPPLFDRRRPTLKASDIHPDNHSDLSTPATNPHSHVRHPSPNPNIVASLPLTPLTLGSPAEPSSLPSSPKSTSTRSLKPFDEISNQDEAEREDLHFGESTERFDASQLHDSAPQLVMPSIKMPSRRPFTQRGRNMGRFKILVSGAAGSGKTSLVKSFVQICEDIVHVDPPPPSAHETPERRKSQSKSSARHSKGPVQIAEIYASTKPYPSWWSDLEDSRVLRRRKSMGDIVLERNLCFVDAPGTRISRADQTESVIQYMNQQFQRTLNAVSAVNTDLQGLLGGNGGSQVDAVLYLISEATLAADIECIRKLSDFSNVIPVISKTDLLSQGDITSLKKAFHSRALDAGVKPFLFRDTVPDLQDGTSSSPPFAISSAVSNDDETMEASLLMSPDYVQPLMPSELGILVEKIFDQDNLSWLRHSAAKKLIQRHEGPQEPRLNTKSPARPGSAISHFSPSVGFSSASSISDSQVLVSRPGSSPGYSLARVADHTQREERLAQVRLARWASDLQQSLQNERERYEALARGERAVWLTERLNECVVDGTLVPLSRTPGFSGEECGDGELFTREGKRGQRVRYRVGELPRHDPLGLVGWDEEVKRRGWMVVQVVGGFGVVGGLALWLGKSWGVTSGGVFDWNLGRLGGSDY